MTGEYSFSVPEESDGLRLDVYLSEELSEISRSYISKVIRSGGVFLRDRAGKASDRVRSGDSVRLSLPENSVPEVEAENIPLDILYEDEDVIVVNKPKGMVVHPAPGHYTGTLVNALLWHCHDLSGIGGVSRPGIVHRIDRDTTGSLLVCKNDYSHRKISEALREHSLTRLYETVVYGGFSEEEGVIDAPIGRHIRDRKRFAVSADGRRAVTRYRVIEHMGNYTRLECRLETGRTHQIRVHMAHIGHPVVGDELYSKASFPVRTDGQVLHARTLGFCQPHTGEYIEIEAPLPEYFRKVVEYILSRHKI
ncbi:MAG: RluA family pseudouridine synthase [Lachnospiraceae bacterium]|nr:RluA family pseudouridine synthase [Lachnospiraceae bacterium]